MNQHQTYESPLTSRYSSPDMQALFSSDFKFSTWRRLWVALAEAEKELGLPITERQIAEMRANIGNIDYDKAAAYEKETRHDVMAHIRAYGDLCPSARPIIHLGATSCYVGDNTDLIIMKNALDIVRQKILAAVSCLADFAEHWKSQPTLAFTHFQPAQPTTVGKRATLWINDLLMDLDDLDYVSGSLKLLGSKGTTGTAASFLELFSGDEKKITALDKKIAEKMCFADVYPVSGQTYSRKVDFRVLSVLSSVAQSAAKFSNDIRLLQHLKEVEEPFESGQVGSSAMAYKRNPMRSERIASLARYIIACAQNPANTAAAQWFERTLDDSANKRIAVPEAFLAVDAVLNLMINVGSGLVVYPEVIRKRLMAELPFMATENILMDAVKKGGDRQDLHEKIRVLSHQAAKVVKEQGGDNDLLQRIAADPAFGLSEEELAQSMDPGKYCGMAERQTETYLEEIVRPVLAANEVSRVNVEINV